MCHCAFHLNPPRLAEPSIHDCWTVVQYTLISVLMPLTQMILISNFITLMSWGKKSLLFLSLHVVLSILDKKTSSHSVLWVKEMVWWDGWMDPLRVNIVTQQGLVCDLYYIYEANKKTSVTLKTVCVNIFLKPCSVLQGDFLTMFTVQFCANVTKTQLWMVCISTAWCYVVKAAFSRLVIV